MKRIFTTALLLFMCVLIRAQGLRVGTALPDILLKDKQMNEISSKKLNVGRNLIVNFYTPAFGNLNAVYFKELMAVYKNFGPPTMGPNCIAEMMSVGFDNSVQEWMMHMQNEQLPYIYFPNNVFEEATVGSGNSISSPLINKFAIRGFPSNVVLDENGVIALVNAKPMEIDKYLRKKLSDVKVQIKKNDDLLDLVAKLLYGVKKDQPLVNQKVMLIGSNGSVIDTAVTDLYGDFTFNKVNAGPGASIMLEDNELLKRIKEVYLATQAGTIVRTIQKNSNGRFNYKLLPADIQKLADVNMEDPELVIGNFAKSGGKEITIAEDIHYSIKEYKVTPEIAKQLTGIVKIMKENKALKLEIYSHTDAIGEDEFNLDLSRKRAQAVMEHLVSQGLDKARMKSSGMGEQKLLNRCANGVNCSEKEHALNRRTEFKFIKP